MTGDVPGSHPPRAWAVGTLAGLRTGNDRKGSSARTHRAKHHAPGCFDAPGEAPRQLNIPWCGSPTSARVAPTRLVLGHARDDERREPVAVLRREVCAALEQRRTRVKSSLRRSAPTSEQDAPSHHRVALALCVHGSDRCPAGHACRQALHRGGRQDAPTERRQDAPRGPPLLGTMSAVKPLLSRAERSANCQLLATSGGRRSSSSSLSVREIASRLSRVCSRSYNCGLTPPRPSTLPRAESAPWRPSGRA